MSAKIEWFLPWLLLSGLALVARPAPAQEQRPATKPDSPAVMAHIEKAKTIAGSVWAEEEHFLCEAPRATPAPDPGPAKLFDNVYALPGQYSAQNGVVYALTTSAGIMLIDAGRGRDVEPVVIAGLKTLGLDPANIRVIVIAHGHEDHYGGATLLQQRYGAHVVSSAADWVYMSNPTTAQVPPFPVTPKRDMVAVEGQPITLGDESITPVLIPGHTPGSLGFIFPVKEGGKTHMAALFGGGFIAFGPPNQVEQFIDSLVHFETWAKKMKVDVELQNHPVMDGFGEKLVALRARKPGDPNPFIVGQENYVKFLDVMTECARAQLARLQE